MQARILRYKVKMQKVQSRLNIIFAAFLFSSLVYLMVGFALTKSGWKPILTEGDLDQILFAIFLAVSVGLVVLVVQIKNKFAQAEGPEQAAQTIFSKSVFLFALAEVPAILGLVLFLLTGKFLYLLILCAMSLLAFVMAKPRSQ